MSNEFYTHSTYPATGASGSSASMRNELDLISQGFDKLPTMTSNGYKLVMVNASGSGLAAAPGLYADGSGKLGVGTSTPSYNLSIVSGAIGAPAVLSLGTSTQAKVRIGVEGVASGLVNGSAQGDLSIFNGSGAMNWSVDNGTTMSMRLDASGSLGLGVATPLAKLHVVGSSYRQNDATNSYGYTVATAASKVTFAGINGSAYFAWQTALSGADQLVLDTSGNLIQTVPTTPPSLAANSQMVFNLTSNTNLRVSVRGTDGVTRVANITLA